MFLTGDVVTESGLRIYYKLSTMPSSGKIKKNKVKMWYLNFDNKEQIGFQYMLLELKQYQKPQCVDCLFL